MKKRLDFPQDTPAPNDYMLEIGRMTVYWGCLENEINIAINSLAGYDSGIDFRALILIAHSNFQQRINMVGALCEQLLPSYPKLGNYKKIIAKIEAAQKARNKYAHNAVIKNPETGDVTVSYASARGELKISVEKVHINDIKEASAKIHESLCALHSLVTGNELKPMWERNA